METGDIDLVFEPEILRTAKMIRGHIAIKSLTKNIGIDKFFIDY